MDPDALLKELREMIRANNEGGIVDVDEIADAFDALDRWIMSGGFLPAMWADKLVDRKRWEPIQSSDPWQTPTKHESPF